MKDWSNLAKIVFRRTYSRKDHGVLENWPDTVARYVGGNIKGFNVPEWEVKELVRLGLERKAIPAGRGLWFSGSPAHDRIGGAANNNCWYFSMDNWENYVLAQDLLMLGGGVGMSIEHRFVSQLPKVKKNVSIALSNRADADFIVPDSREGWCELLRRVLESYFVTGRSFTYSTICIRGYGEPIAGFGGTSSGYKPLALFIHDIGTILSPREGKHVRPIDAMDLLCACGKMVVAGNVRRSAIIILGDAFDKEFLKAKRWTLGNIPAWRAFANLSVVVDDIEDDLSPLFWKTYHDGEPFGLVNRKNIRTYGRMTELKPDTAMGVNPCVPAGTLVLTHDGYHPIESLINIPQKVWNGFEWSEVVPKVTGRDQPLVNVLFNSGQDLTCTTYHEFVIATDYNGGTERVRAKDLKPGMKLVKTDYPVIQDGICVPPDLAYTQGFISAEGMDDYRYFHVYGDKSKCCARMMATYGPYDYKQGRLKAVPRFEQQLKSFVPAGWSLESRLEWLAGLMDGDGTVTIEGGLQIASVNVAFLSDVQLMLTTMGVASKINCDKRSKFKMMPDGKGGQKEYFCQDLYRLMICAKDIQNLSGLGLVCERLQIVGFTPNRNAARFVRVVDVIDAGMADTVYCFTELNRQMGCFNGIVTGQCAEACLESAEPCNLQEIALMNLESQAEFNLAARLMHRYGKRVTCQRYHHPVIDEVVKRNRRVGTGITGCLGSKFFTPKALDEAYNCIQLENWKYSQELGVPESIRTTVVKPSGTVSKLLDQDGYEGIHAAYSRYIIQRIRFASSDPLIPLLRKAGHHVEPVLRFDGTLDQSTLVVDFYVEAPAGFPVADEDWGTWQQLDTLLLAQKHWSDQSCSVTIYYKREEIPQLKEWLKQNFQYLKTISFLCHSDHGFKQAPKEAISQELFEKKSAKIQPISFEAIGEGDLESQECAGGVCPIK